ncbi:MAG: tRNA (adenosine(37)-N6)-dimethylallyltransferase MiaA [Candidatus Aminicenantes bacterium]|nr:tRNA (adenosine(37)-N6)-dimethylallyltransferase MiaA [Candidatus Aminicenantes bacterium]
MNKIVQIIGPTGVGKSRLAVFLSEKFNGEIISADSVQIYKGFDIGSSKISESEKRGVPHHMIDILDADEHFSVNKFLELTVDIVKDMNTRGKLPVVCGGTALYLRAMIRGIFEENMDKRISREQLIKIEEEKGLDYLWGRLYGIDKEYAEKIGPADKQRIIRGLEIYYNNRITPSNISSITTSPFKDHEFIRIGLKLQRQLMYERINKRVDEMVGEGLLEEVEELLKIHESSCSPMMSIGYKEMSMVLRNEIGQNAAVNLIKQHSRNFAKRQMTWFRSEKDITWFEPHESSEILTFLKQKINESN